MFPLTFLRRAGTTWYTSPQEACRQLGALGSLSESPTLPSPWRSSCSCCDLENSSFFPSENEGELCRNYWKRMWPGHPIQQRPTEALEPDTHRLGLVSDASCVVLPLQACFPHQENGEDGSVCLMEPRSWGCCDST